jgi:TctA family transporter
MALAIGHGNWSVFVSTWWRIGIVVVIVAVLASSIYSSFFKKNQGEALC